MGYHTDFNGSFKLDKPLLPEHAAYLRAFCNTRRMRRDAAFAALLADPVREAAGLPIGHQGAYFVGGGSIFGQEKDDTILDYNNSPSDQPGLWCQWEPNEDGTEIGWDGGEKFYDYVRWIEYLIKHFLKPWGYVLNGSVEWDGEEREDLGIIDVTDNIVETRHGSIVYN